MALRTQSCLSKLTQRNIFVEKKESLRENEKSYGAR